MTLLEILIIFFAIIGTYAALVYILHKKKILQKYDISFYGPMLMWRTTKGRDFLRRIAQKKRFWAWFGNFGIILCFVFMIVMVVLLIMQAWSILGYTPEQIAQLPGPEVALVIPGLNPILPLEYLGYIILALVIAMVVHEFSHGILTYASNLKVKALGILYLILPLGAFCEPDEEDLQKTKPGNRMRIFAAGPTMNFLVVLISIFLLSVVCMSSVQPAASDGVCVLSVSDDTPAATIGITKGMIITSINDTTITNTTDFVYIMDQTHTNQTVNISYVKGVSHYNGTITLSDKYQEYAKRGYPNNESFRDKGYIGIGPSVMHKGFLKVLKNPFVEFPNGFLLFYVLPLFGYFQGYNPISAPFTDSYIVTGVLGAIPLNLFWMIVNALYWIFWLNFAVAVFNVLPAVPLDGGYLFKDAVYESVRRIKRNATEEKRQKIVKNVSLAISLVILFLIIFPWLIKYV